MRMHRSIKKEQLVEGHHDIGDFHDFGHGSPMLKSVEHGFTLQVVGPGRVVTYIVSDVCNVGYPEGGSAEALHAMLRKVAPGGHGSVSNKCGAIVAVLSTHFVLAYSYDDVSLTLIKMVKAIPQ